LWEKHVISICPIKTTKRHIPRHIEGPHRGTPAGQTVSQDPAAVGPATQLAHYLTALGRQMVITSMAPSHLGSRALTRLSSPNETC
jgi:hypothetical protein